MPQATVTKVEQGGIIRIRVRRNSRDETLYARHDDLRVGDKLQVKRQTNNPFPVRCKEDQ